LEYSSSEMQDCFSVMKYIPEAQTNIRYDGTYFLGLKCHDA